MAKKLIIAAIMIAGLVGRASCSDAKLQEYIDTALKNNPEVIALENSYISAKYKSWEAKSMLFPQVSAVMSASRRVSPLSATFGDTALFPGLPANMDVTTYSQGLSAQMNIYDFGRTCSVISRASISRELSYLGYEKKKQEVIYNVKKGYYGLMQAISMKNLAAFNLTEMESLYNSVKDREQAGLATPIDVLNIESQYLSFKADVPKADHNIEIANSAFSNLLGKEETDQVIISEANFPEPGEYPLGFKSYEECRDKALALRLDFKELEFQEKLAKTNVSGARSEWMPSLTANGDYLWQDSTYPPNKDSWSAAVNLSLPIFRGGGNYAKLKSAGADLGNARATIKQASRNILIQIKSNYYKALEEKEKYDATAKKRTYLEKNHEAVSAKFKEGLASLTELIEAQTKKSNGELELQQALFSYHNAINELEYSVGGAPHTLPSE